MRLAPKRVRQWGDFPAWDWAEGSARHVLVRGGMVEVVRLGRGEPIVVVPGLAGGRRLTMPLAQHLARSHEVVLFDPPGERGPSGGRRPEDLEGYARDLAEVLDALHLERPTVFGVSFGGAVALELAVERPGRLGALVVFGAEARFRVGLGATIARRVLERYPLPGDSRFLNQFFNLLHGGPPGSRELADFVTDRCWETDQGVMASRLRALEGFDVSDRLWRIDMPTLVLAGSRDVIVPLARQRALAEGIAGARFAALPGAGHVGFLTHAGEIRRHVGRLLHGRQRSPR